jgi:hypothetical protein
MDFVIDRIHKRRIGILHQVFFFIQAAKGLTSWSLD